MDFLLQEADTALSELWKAGSGTATTAIDYTQVEEVAASQRKNTSNLKVQQQPVAADCYTNGACLACDIKSRLAWR
jgi:hypothetical protein